MYKTKKALSGRYRLSYLVLPAPTVHSSVYSESGINDVKRKISDRLQKIVLHSQEWEQLTKHGQKRPFLYQWHIKAGEQNEVLIHLEAGLSFINCAIFVLYATSQTRERGYNESPCWLQIIFLHSEQSPSLLAPPQSLLNILANEWRECESQET